MAISKKARRALANAMAPSFFDAIPIDLIEDAIGPHGLHLVNEDGTPFSAIFCGREGHSSIDTADETGKVVGRVILTWYKSDARSARHYDCVAYFA